MSEGRFGRGLFINCDDAMVVHILAPLILNERRLGECIAHGLVEVVDETLGQSVVNITEKGQRFAYDLVAYNGKIRKQPSGTHLKADAANRFYALIMTAG